MPYTERQRQRGREREGDTKPKQDPGSELSAQRQKRGSNPQTMRSCPDPK